jgi:ankyrin repeat protein
MAEEPPKSIGYNAECPYAPVSEPPSTEPFPLHDCDSPFHKAAHKGDVATLPPLIASGENIDARSYHGCTPLHLAIRGNQGDAVRILLSLGADPTLKDSNDSALCPPFDTINLAAHVGTHHAIAALIDHGVVVPASALSKAASLGHVECVDTIIQKMGQTDFSDASRLDGVRVALGAAALCWWVEAVECLLTRVDGFPDTNVQEDRDALGRALANVVSFYDCDDRCRNPYPFGRQERLFNVMNQLVVAGVNVNDPVVTANVSNPEGDLPAFWAATYRADLGLPRDVIHFLLANGLRLDSVDHRGQTPLFEIVKQDSEESTLLEEFIAAGASVVATDAKLRTPLHFARYLSFAELLNRHGADLFAKDIRGRTPLHQACSGGRLDVVQFLVSTGANVEDAATEADWTPLLFATCDEQQADCANSSERLAITKLLLENGANIRASASDGQTALHGAARLGDAELVRLLIERGADVRAVKTNGEMVLHATCEYYVRFDMSQKLAIACMLADQVVDLEARDENGATALFLTVACSQYFTSFTADLTNALISRGADRFAEDHKGKKVVDLVESGTWMWSDDGMLRAKPVPEAKFAQSASGRGGYSCRWCSARRGYRGTSR